MTTKFHLHNILCSQIVNTQHFMLFFMHSHHTNFIFHKCTSGWVIEQNILVIKILYSKKCSFFLFSFFKITAVPDPFFFCSFHSHTVLNFYLTRLDLQKKNIYATRQFLSYHTRLFLAFLVCGKIAVDSEIFMRFFYIHTDGLAVYTHKIFALTLN